MSDPGRVGTRFGHGSFVGPAPTGCKELRGDAQGHGVDETAARSEQLERMSPETRRDYFARSFAIAALSVSTMTRNAIAAEPTSSQPASHSAAPRPSADGPRTIKRHTFPRPVSDESAFIPTTVGFRQGLLFVDGGKVTTERLLWPVHAALLLRRGSVGTALPECWPRALCERRQSADPFGT